MVKLNAPTKSPEEIAKKFKLTLRKVKNLIDTGAKVEKEHTKDPKAAREVARDHLGERPDYYKKLGKMEKSKIEKLEEISKNRLAKYVSKIAKMPSYSREGEYYYKNEKFGELAIAKMAGKKNDPYWRPKVVATESTNEKTEMSKLDEISKDLAQHYRDKADKDISRKQRDAGQWPSAKTISGKQAQFHKKAKGLEKAAQRLGYVELAKKKFKDTARVNATSKYNEETEMSRLDELTGKNNRKNFKNKVEEAVSNLISGNYIEMQNNLNESLQEKVILSLEERKKVIASQYFGQSE